VVVFTQMRQLFAATLAVSRTYPAPAAQVSKRTERERELCREVGAGQGHEEGTC
jgi:hypothetical protein